MNWIQKCVKSGESLPRKGGIEEAMATARITEDNGSFDGKVSSAWRAAQRHAILRVGRGR